MKYNPTSEQNAVIQATESVLVTAPPGTGKTVTALAYARAKAPSLKEGQRILFLSFSNAAVNRMASASDQHLTASERSKVHFATYHSAAWTIVRQYGRFAGLPPSPKILDNVDLSVLPLRLQKDPALSLLNYLNQAAKEHGLVHFDIMVSIALKVLNASSTIRKIEGNKFPIIIVDEFQDTNDEQFEFLQAIGVSSQVLAFGDSNQVLYDKEYGQAVERETRFMQWKSIATKVTFTENFRCGKKPILELAQCIIKPAQFTKPSGEPVYYTTYYSTSLRSTLAQLWLEIERNPELIGKSVGILTPSMTKSREICSALRNPPETSKLRKALYPRVTLKDEQKESVRLAIASIKQLQNDGKESNVRAAAESLCWMKKAWSTTASTDPSAIAKIIEELSAPKSKRSKERPLYTLTKQTSLTPSELEKATLEALSKTKIFESVAGSIASTGFRFLNNELLRSLVQRNSFDCYLASREPKGLHGREVPHTEIEVLSTYRSKGREFDIVIIIADPYAHVGRSISSIRRLYYVAATRARELVVILHRGNNHSDPVWNPVFYGTDVA